MGSNPSGGITTLTREIVMGEKLKLSIIADAGAPTGFATVTHNIARYLQNTGEYDIQILGINYHGEPNEWSKEFNIWPAKLGGDFLGARYAGKFFEDTKPDVILLFQDFWNIPLYLGALKHPMPGVVGYFPVDSPNVKGMFMLSLAACVELGCYTNFGVDQAVLGAKEAWTEVKHNARRQGVDVVDSFAVGVQGGLDPKTGMTIGGGELTIFAQNLKRFTRPENYFVIPHGIDTSSFYPMDMGTARDEFGFDKDWFIVGNINRNQSRKRLDLTVKGFAEFAKDKPDARLLLHSVREDGRGWDLPQLAYYYGVLEKVILTHNMFAGKVASIHHLNLIHNACDVMVNTGGGEGWGLNSFESAACAKPQIVPNWSATAEIWQDAALMIDVLEVRHELSGINTAQAVIDTSHFASLLSELYEDREKLLDVSHKCYAVTQRQEYKWENVGSKFDKIFKDAAGKTPRTGPVPLNPQGVMQIKRKQGQSAVVPVSK